MSLTNLIPGVAQAKVALRFLPYAGIALLAIFAAIQWQNARHWEKLYIDSEKAHIATKAAYTGAQIAAQELNKAEVARIESEYAAIAAKTEIEYEKRIADNRATLDRWMRKQAAERAAKGTGTGETSEVQPEATATGEVPNVSGGVAIVPVSDLELVAGAYAKLAALQDAANAIEGVQTNAVRD
jgi:hypothetical protein